MTEETSGAGGAPQGRKGVLIVAPDGQVYNIPGDDLARFVVPADRVEETIIAAEQEGFVETAPLVEDAPKVSEYTEAAAPRTPSLTLNIFFGDQQQPGSGVTVVPVGEQKAARAAQAEYGGLAAGSTMAKYAAGSTMAKYAAGSTMAKYAAGAGVQPRVVHPVTMLYGKW